MRAAIRATYVALSITVLLLSSGNYKSAPGQGQQQFQDYQSPTLGVSIQYPSDWELLEESNDKLRFIKQEGFITADLNVENLDQSDATLPEYANTRVNELRTQRPGFQLLSFEPTIISNDIPAQKVVYTFEREEDGKTNKVMRIWSINEGKLYTLAYIAESSQYDRYLPAFQRMVDSFNIDADAGGSSTQVQSREDSNGGENCDRISYPDPNVCIPPFPPDLNCPDIPYKNFEVTGGDPHGFDRDNDGIGCESENAPPIPPPNLPICDENTPPETPCIDEGDPDDPPICTPDGPPCPPCPEGVEAGWCADEDERGDFDCGDPDMENDPRCENGEPVNGSEEEGEGETTEEPAEEEEGSQPEGSEGSTGEGETGVESPT